MERSFGDLQFLLDEFSKLEVVLAPESKESESHNCYRVCSRLKSL